MNLKLTWLKGIVSLVGGMFVSYLIFYIWSQTRICDGAPSCGIDFIFTNVDEFVFFLSNSLIYKVYFVVAVAVIYVIWSLFQKKKV